MSALDEETVDWGDVEATAATNGSTGGDDVISLGGAEDLEEEIVTVPAKEETAVEEVKAKENTVDEVKPVVRNDAAPAKALPPGWKLQEARSGGVYYFNTVTGQTTWDFPTDSETAATTTNEAATPVVEKKLGGIQIRGAGLQIRGAARSNGSVEKKEDEPDPSSRKREVDNLVKEEVPAQELPQKRRRSNTPEEKKESKSIETSPPARKPQDRSQGHATEEDARERRAPSAPSAPSKDRITGWGRRADIASDSKGTGGVNANKSRHDSYSRVTRETNLSDSRARDGGNNDGPRRNEMGERDYSRSQGNDTYAQSQSGGYESSKGPTNRYSDERNVSSKTARDRGYDRNDRKREASPPPRSRRESDRVESTREEGRDRPRERDTRDERREVPRERDTRDKERDRYSQQGIDRGSRGTEKDSRRDYNRDNAPSRSREAERPVQAKVSAEPSRSSRAGADNFDRDARSASTRPSLEGKSYRSGSFQDQSSAFQNQGNNDRGYSNQGYGNQGYGIQGKNYMDRSGSKPPFSPAGSGTPNNGSNTPQRSQQGGYQQGPQGYQSYRPQGFRPDSTPKLNESSHSAADGSGGGYNRWGQQPLQQGGARPLRPFVPPEEKQKRWWNKNTGEKKPVDPEAFAEAEGRGASTTITTPMRKPSSTPSVEPAPRQQTDRERELAEREAAIARKERELGLK
ncbi:hypothetical protein CBS101457_005192 [Exobasidium rhododendri]|nr:hypothetical protein CBS101457_005192 [Exobasidium rhododendri]